MKVLRQIGSRFRRLPSWAKVLAGVLAVVVVVVPFTGGATKVSERTAVPGSVSPVTSGPATSSGAETAPSPTAAPTGAPATGGPTTLAPTTTPQPAPRTGPPATGRPGECHPSYAGACLPRTPDIDCPDQGDGPYVVEKNVEVVGSDDHGLDPDGDGRACES